MSMATHTPPPAVTAVSSRAPGRTAGPGLRSAGIQVVPNGRQCCGKLSRSSPWEGHCNQLQQTSLRPHPPRRLLAKHATHEDRKRSAPSGMPAVITASSRNMHIMSIAARWRRRTSRRPANASGRFGRHPWGVPLILTQFVGSTIG